MCSNAVVWYQSSGICLICYFNIISLTFICVSVISDVFFAIEGQNVKFQVASESSNHRQSAVILPRTQNALPSSSLCSERNNSGRIIKTQWAPANKSSPSFNYAQPDLTWAIEMKTGFMQQPNHCVFFLNVGSKSQIPYAVIFSLAALKLFWLLTFGIIPDSLWTFLSRCQLVWNVLRGSASTPVAAATV